MRIMIDFFRTMWLMPLPWRLWVGLLMLLNGVAPLLFIASIEGQVVLLTLLLSAGTMMALFERKGFVRLLGLGHIYWLPLILWLASRLSGSESPMTEWLLAVIACNSVSLAIDAVDVVRYALGEKAPTLALPRLAVVERPGNSDQAGSV